MRILIADDNVRIAQGLRVLFELESDFTVVGTASSGSEALRLARLLRPDLVIMDYRMPEMDGIDAARLIKETVPSCRVVVLSVYDNIELRRRAIDAGVAAWLVKDMDRASLVSAIRQSMRPQKSTHIRAIPNVQRKEVNR